MAIIILKHRTRGSLIEVDAKRYEKNEPHYRADGYFPAPMEEVKKTVNLEEVPEEAPEEPKKKTKKKQDKEVGQDSE